MKILHCSDIHLGKRPAGTADFANQRYEDYFTAFENIVDYAVENSVEVFLVAGDFFDKKEINPLTLHKTEGILKKLKANDVSVLICEGNHDKSQAEENSWIGYLEGGGYLKKLSYLTSYEDGTYIFQPHSIDGVDFYGVGFNGAFTEKVLLSLSDFLEGKNGGNNVVLAHTAIAGGEEFVSGTVGKEVIDGFAGKVLYMAGGHLHNYYSYPSENPYFFLPGSSEYWNILNERKKGAQKGFILFDTETCEHSFVENKKRTVINTSVDLSKCEKEEVESVISEYKEGLIPDESAILMIEIVMGDTIIVDYQKVEEEVEELGFFKVFVKPRYTSSMYGSIDSLEKLPVEEIEKGIISGWENFSSHTEKVANLLQHLKRYQTEGEEELFFNEFDNMLEEMLEGGADLEDK